MSDCCRSHDNHNNSKNEETIAETPPKSIIGKYLYNLGRKESIKEKQISKKKK